MVTNILLLHHSKGAASIPIQLTPHTAANVFIPRMQSLPAIPLYKVLLWLPISFRKMSKILLRVHEVLMSYILLTSQQHLLPHITLNSALQLKGIYPIPQTSRSGAFKHAIASSLLFTQHPFLLHLDSYFFQTPSFMPFLLIRYFSYSPAVPHPSVYHSIIMNYVCVLSFSEL